MEFIETRDLDGPNLFLLEPAIKLEARLAPDERLGADARARLAAAGVPDPGADPLQALRAAIAHLHRAVGLQPPATGQRRLDPDGHHAVFFPWEWRSCALGIARAAYELVSGEDRGEDPAPALRQSLARDRQTGDRPVWVRDGERLALAAAITGTNGKTTTTRLVAHIARRAGRRTGWCSSTGVYIDGERVIEGDYTGPAGAQRVLSDPDVEVAVLETARGGILLRGLGYESNDAGVFLNISADHLGLHGVHRLETLAEVKSVVVRVTRPGGVAVLNADDPLVLACRDQVRAEVLLISQDPESAVIRAHLAAGGRALVRERDAIVLRQGAERVDLIAPREVPMTYGGAARHMVENALAGAGAALGLGLSLDAIASGLRTFRSDARLNTGRLNLFRLDGRLIVVDYAHNERGLETLIDFTRAVMEGSGRLLVIIGTAGDRGDEVFRGLGRIAASRAERVFLKENPRYYRGREPGSTIPLMRQGVCEAGGEKRLAGAFPTEHAALVAALAEMGPGDALAVMCVEDQLAVLRELRDRGAQEWS